MRNMFKGSLTIRVITVIGVVVKRKKTQERRMVGVGVGVWVVFVLGFTVCTPCWVAYMYCNTHTQSEQVEYVDVTSHAYLYATTHSFGGLAHLNNKHNKNC